MNLHCEKKLRNNSEHQRATSSHRSGSTDTEQNFVNGALQQL